MRPAAAQCFAVTPELVVGSGVDDTREAVLAQCVADRVDELDGELAVAVGEPAAAFVGQRPRGGRAARAARHRHPRADHAHRFEGAQVLAYGGLGEPQLRGEPGRGGRLLELEDLEHPLARGRDPVGSHGRGGYRVSQGLP